MATQEFNTNIYNYEKGRFVPFIITAIVAEINRSQRRSRCIRVQQAGWCLIKGRLYWLEPGEYAHFLENVQALDFSSAHLIKRADDLCNSHKVPENGRLIKRPK